MKDLNRDFEYISLCCEAQELIYRGFTLNEAGRLQGVSYGTIRKRMSDIQHMPLNDAREIGRRAIIDRYKRRQRLREERRAA